MLHLWINGGRRGLRERGTGGGWEGGVGRTKISQKSFLVHLESIFLTLILRLTKILYYKESIQ